MGNTNVRDRLRRQSSDKFLGTDGYMTRLKQFYSDDLEGTEHEKFKFVETLVDNNDSICQLLESSGIEDMSKY